MTLNTRNSVALRIACDLILAICVIYGWWYVALPIGVCAVWFFPIYLEFILGGFVYDALFGMNGSFLLAGYAGLIVTVIAFALASLLRRKLR